MDVVPANAMAAEEAVIGVRCDTGIPFFATFAVLQHTSRYSCDDLLRLLSLHLSPPAVFQRHGNSTKHMFENGLTAAVLTDSHLYLHLLG
ncbi:MAG: hypothetical protein M0032_02535 [Actinomycetota bacterium]|nr:hypothetical protein [Actinomycetota bacterium]